MFWDLGKHLIFQSIGRGIRIPRRISQRIEEIDWLSELIRREQVTAFIDVGANKGQTVDILRTIGFTGHIFSFEPYYAAYSEMERRYAADDLWRGYRVALSDERASATLHVNMENSVMSSLQQPKPFSHQYTTDIVDVIPLDEFLPTLLEVVEEPRFFLKIDTEGSDLKVMRGATDTLKYVRALQTELWFDPPYRHVPAFTEQLDAFQDAGFNVINFSVVSRKPSDEIECMNCLMSRKRL